MSHRRQDVSANLPGRCNQSLGGEVQLGESIKAQCVLAREYEALGDCRNWESPHPPELFSTNPARYSQKRLGKDVRKYPLW